MRQIAPHEPEVECLGPDDLEAELALMRRLETEPRRRGRPWLRLEPADSAQDPRMGPEELAEDLAVIRRLEAA